METHQAERQQELSGFLPYRTASRGVGVFILIFSLILCVQVFCLHVYIYAPHTSCMQCLQRVEEGVGIPETEVTG